MMRFVPKDHDDLREAIELLPDEMLVEVGAGVGFEARNVGALRQVNSIPSGIVVGIPKQRAADSVVKVDMIG